jgi:hypothetical protein
MAKNFALPNGLNGVILTFGPNSNAGVHPVLHYFLSRLLTTRLEDFMTPNKFYTLISLHISSTSEPYIEHKIGGPHRNGLAIDIAAINGKPISKLYNYDEELTGSGHINQITKDTKLLSQHKSHLHFSVRP